DDVEGLGEGGAEGRRDVGGQAGERFQAVVLGGDAQAQAFRRVDRPFDGGRRGRGRGAVRGRSPRAAGGGFLVAPLLSPAAEVVGLSGAASAYGGCGGVGAAGGDGGVGGEDRVAQRPVVGDAFGVACPCRLGGDGLGGGGVEPAALPAQVPPEEAGHDGRGDDRVEVGDDDGDVRVGQPVAGRVRREEGGHRAGHSGQPGQRDRRRRAGRAAEEHGPGDLGGPVRAARVHDERQDAADEYEVRQGGPGGEPAVGAGG